MNVTPEKMDKPRRNMYPEGSNELELIPLSPYESYLVSLWREVGSVGSGAMGVVPLSWTEITSWAERFFTEEVTVYEDVGDDQYRPVTKKVANLKDYELQMIRDMSLSYCGESGEDAVMRPCPKEIEEATEETVEVQANSFLDNLKAMGLIKQ